MLQYFKTALWGIVFLLASLWGQMAPAETVSPQQSCVMDSWGAYLDAGPQSFKKREEIKTASGTILAFEFNRISGNYGKVFLFLLDDGKCFTRAVSFGSYAMTNDFAVTAGDVGPDGRLYHSDLYEPGMHSTLGFSETRPTYKVARKTALEILK